jgi:hypothetical protein
VGQAAQAGAAGGSLDEVGHRGSLAAGAWRGPQALAPRLPRATAQVNAPAHAPWATERGLKAQPS